MISVKIPRNVSLFADADWIAWLGENMPNEHENYRWELRALSTPYEEYVSIYAEFKHEADSIRFILRWL